MEPDSASKEEGEELPLPPLIPLHAVPMKEKNGSPPIGEPKKRTVQMARPGFSEKGQLITLLTNHFKVSVRNVDESFFQYSVNLKDEDDQPIGGKGIGRKVINEMQRTYINEFEKKGLAYDGEKTLFTISPLPHKNNEFTVILDDISSHKSSGSGSSGEHGCPDEGNNKRARRFYQVKTIKVELRFAAEIPMQTIAIALKGHETENAQKALSVLDIILRQHAVKQGCHLVRQSFFHDNQSNYTDLGGGVIGFSGFHSSFRPVQGGLSLNIDVSTTIIVRPGPVIDFLIANQNVRDPFQVDWEKAKRMLKNLRVKIRNMEYKIIGLTELPCNQQTFTFRQRGDCGVNTIEITVYDYFVSHRRTPLSYSADLPCIKVGKPMKPAYFPIELCNLVSLQRYKKGLTVQQRASFMEKSRQKKPQERMSSITNALKYMKYDSDPILQECGVSISTDFTPVEGRVLQPPKLIFGNGVQFLPRNGRWNLNNKKLITPIEVEGWAAVNFSARSDTNSIIHDLIICGSMKGMSVKQPLFVFEENPYMRRAPPAARVEDMFDQISSKLHKPPKFILCLLSERKNSLIYGPWKRKCLEEFGIVTQCMAPTRVNDQYLTSLLLKINAKLGGMNSLLYLESITAFPIISKAATIILGMDVSHCSPGRSDVPSIAAVVNSRQWPLISKYRASVRTQSPKNEMIDSMFKLVSGADGKGTYDEGIIREAFVDFYGSSGKRKPEQIIIFRDGVSENQFNQVLNVELDQIKEACKFLDEQWFPKITLIIAQKKHQTRFFLAGGSPDNVPPGTVVDKQVCHPRNYDFYMCSHAGMIGTSRPTHYHILLDENDLNPDDLQEFVHSLSYVYQRSTTAISVASQAAHFIKYEESETSSSQRVPVLPTLHVNVRNSMFFC